MTNKLKCLLVDIETWPVTAYIWQLKEQYVNLKQVEKDWSVAAWSAKWLGDPPSKLIYRSTEGQDDVRDDKTILRKLWELLDEADVVITQNGMAFDCPRLTARFILHGWRPPKPYKHIDTFKIAKRIGGFTSNSLEYLTKKLCKKYKKLSHRKFPGITLWAECLNRNKAAWREMRIYNIHDVLSMEELYLKLRPWAPESMPTPFVPINPSATCRVCGSKAQRRGKELKRKYFVERIHCQNPKCGKWTTGDKVR